MSPPLIYKLRAAQAIKPAALCQSVLVLLLLVCCSGATHAQETRALEPGKPIERGIITGELHNYSVQLAAGQYLQVLVEQQGIKDIRLALYAPDGNKLLEQDENNLRGPDEPLTALASLAGNYRLELKCIGQVSAEGNYLIRLEELRTATGADRKRVAADALFHQAQEMKASTTETRRAAIEKYLAALRIFDEIGARGRTAKTYGQIAYLYFEMHEREQALSYFTRSRELWRELGNPREECVMANNIGTVYYNQFFDLRRAAEFSSQSLALAQQAGDRWSEAGALLQLGLCEMVFGERSKSREHLEQARALFEAVNDPGRQAVTLIRLAYQYQLDGDAQKPLDAYLRAEALGRQAGDRWAESFAIAGQGEIYSLRGDKKRALGYYERALPLSRELDNPTAESSILMALGNLYLELGELEKAVTYQEQALALLKNVENRIAANVILGNLASAYLALGEYQKALDIYQQTLDFFKQTGNRQEQARSLTNVGSIYFQLGDYQKAIDFSNQGLKISRDIIARNAEVTALGNLGASYYGLRNVPKALDYYNQALKLARAMLDSKKESVALSNLGKLYFDEGEKEQALEYYTQALAIKQQIGDRAGEAITANNIGDVYYHLASDKERAREYYNQSLQLSQSIGHQQSEAVALNNLAVIERDLGHLPEARRRIEAAISLVESLRIKISSQELRASFVASMHDLYETYIDILMRLHRERPQEGFDGEALQANERARARSLLEILNEARADIRQGVDPQLLERERSLQQELNGKARRRMLLLGGKHTDEEAQALAQEIDGLTAQLQETTAEIRVKSPHYAALTQPTPLSLQRIQKEVLDRDTLLLEYSLGKEKSYLWAVTEKDINSYELPGRAEIEAAAREVYELLDARNHRLKGETPDERQLRIAQADARYAVVAARLSRLILLPVAAQLKNRRLVVVADGALDYIPFGALPAPARDSALPLVFRHEVISLPSASTLAVLRSETAGRQRAPKLLAVIADPVFEKDDARVRPAGTEKESQSEAARILEQDEDEPVGATAAPLSRRIRRLPGTRQEGERILSLVPETESLKAFDFAANRALATSDELSLYRYVQFATHGYLDAERPELSALVLSLVDEKGEEQAGFLRAHEIYNLKLPAELVVLSACQTGLGKEIKGEGLVGLTRGFMYAGAPRVVVSLWSVSDQATAQLMERFYQGMLKEKLSPAAALRAAQVALIKEKKWVAPYYWAAFTLQGEWR